MNSAPTRSAIGGRIRTASASILLVILLLYVLMGGFHLPQGSSVYREIENAAHIPLFALLALGALHLLRAGPFGPLRRFPWDYLGALVSASGLGALTELLQFYSPTRDADFNDLGRDIIGAVVLLGVHLTTGRERLGRGSPGARWGVQTLCALLLLAALSPLILTWAASIDRKERFPVICDFESRLQMRMINTNLAELDRMAPPDGWRGNRSGHAGRLALEPGEFPGIAITGPFPDWSPYGLLRLDLYNPGEDTLSVDLRIDDRDHNNVFGDRFNTIIRAVPGENRIAIPLAEIERAPEGRLMDLSRIGSIRLFVYKNRDRLIVHLDDLRLE